MESDELATIHIGLALLIRQYEAEGWRDHENFRDITEERSNSLKSWIMNYHTLSTKIRILFSPYSLFCLCLGLFPTTKNVPIGASLLHVLRKVVGTEKVSDLVWKHQCVMNVS